VSPSVRRRGKAKSAQSARRIIFLTSIFVAVLSSAWVVGRDLLTPKAGGEQYQGMVRLAPDREGRCEQFELDNRTGLIQPRDAIPCGYDVTRAESTRPASGSGSLGRLNGISDHFRSR
jgi:hypothetical protein